MLPIVTDSYSKVCNIFIRVKRITTHSNNSIPAIFFNQTGKGELAFIIDVGEVMKQFFWKFMEVG